MDRVKIFISYSHKDISWLERLRVHLKPLERDYEFDIWDDRQIKAGQNWRDEINLLISTAKVAVLIISADFLASEFITENELPPLLDAAEIDGAKILSLIVSPSRFTKMERISKYQTVNDPSMPLINLSRGQQEEILVKLSEDIEENLKLVPKLKEFKNDYLDLKKENIINKQQLQILEKGVGAWNQWRKFNPQIMPNLEGAILNNRNLIGIDFSSTNLKRCNLSGANLNKANLSKANISSELLIETDLSESDLRNANLTNSNLTKADLSNAFMEYANLKEASLRQADLHESILRGADLSRADLQRASFVMTNLENASLQGCFVYGISAWNLNLKNAKQSNLVISLPDDISITSDDLEVAQFLYMFLNNEKIRNIFSALHSKNVLILGNFVGNRKVVLNEINTELRKLNYIPIIFDFDKPVVRDFTETLYTMASLSRFIIIDITSSKSAPMEMATIIPSVRIPIIPLIEEGHAPYAMFTDLIKYPWVLSPLQYGDVKSIVQNFQAAIIQPIENKIKELKSRSTENINLNNFKINKI